MHSGGQAGGTETRNGGYPDGTWQPAQTDERGIWNVKLLINTTTFNKYKQFCGPLLKKSFY